MRRYAAMEECPRFKHCSVPYCPLDPLRDYGTVLPGDPKCRLPKSRRMEIAKKHGLSWLGLTNRELGARQAEAKMSESDKARRRKNLIPFEPKAHVE